MTGTKYTLGIDFGTESGRAVLVEAEDRYRNCDFNLSL